MKREIHQVDDSKFYEKCKVVTLPTNKSKIFSTDLLKCIKSYSNHLYGDEFDKAEKGEYKMGVSKIANDIYFEKHYPYVIANKEIEDMNVVDSTHCIFFSWQYGGSYDYENPCLAGKDIGRIRTTGKYYEIIATNDESLNLPRLSSEFLRKFCEFNGIKEALVEYEWLLGDEEDENFNLIPELFLKVAPDNTIAIKPVPEEKLYTREEVVDLVKKAYQLGTEKYGDADAHFYTSKTEYIGVETFIKENL